MADNFKYDVFLSHSSKDKIVVRAVAERLRADGLQVWFDEWELKPGDNIPAKIEEGLEHSRVLVLCMSAHAFGSDWAQLEASTFRFRDPLNKERRFIPLRLDETPVRGSLAQFSYINWLPEAQRQEYTKLLAACLPSVEQPVAATLLTEERSPIIATSDGDGALTSPTSLTSPLIESKIEEARRATRTHDENAVHLWEEVRDQAEKENNKAVEIRAQLEIALLHLRGGADLDDVLSILDKCIQDARSIDLGEERPRLLQLLGEAHRLKRNFDQARGFISSALEHSRSLGRKLDEGWALLALSALEKTRGEGTLSAAALDLIQKAYDCFSSVYLSGDQEKQRLAKLGFANCHSWRAAIFDYFQLDDAMTEYARALDIFRGLGEEHEWDVADTLFHRGDLHARADDPQLAAKDFIAGAELFKKLGDRLKKAECILGIGELLDKRLWRRESKPYYEAAATIAMQQKNRKRAAWFWLRYGMKLLELHEFEEAKSIFSTILEADWLTSGQRLDVLKHLCLVTKGTGEKDELERYTKATLDIIDDQIASARSANERRRLIISKGHSLEELGEHERAIACFRRAIEGFEAINDREGIGECWFHIAGVMRETDKKKEEREAYEKVINIFGDNSDSFFVPMSRTMLAQLEISEQNFDEARKHLDQAERENEKLLNPAVLLIITDLRSKLPPT
jgi:tetratricopeptide (TPR) repeat protein